MTNSFVNDKGSLEERVNLFNQMALPGQPLGMHMGTSYLVNDLARENKRLAAEIEALREAAQKLIAHLNERIDAAPSDAVPVFAGLAELYDAVNARAKLEGSGA